MNQSPLSTCALATPLRRSAHTLPRVVVTLTMLVLTSTASLHAQQTRVTGTVTAAGTGASLGGAEIAVKGTAIRVLANSSGAYSVQAPSPNDTLVFTMIGYEQREEPLGGRASVSVQLEPSPIALDAIVVTGYGSQQRRDLTGSIASVDGAEVTELASPSLTQALQGRVPGVQVTPISGEPGEDAIVRIRGVGTLNDASPLYVVDGMMVDDMRFVAPEDVESVEVLKDASATAIYGSRGANGVIIITTKRGSPSHGTTYRFSTYTGRQSVLESIEMVDAQQYAQLANELAANQGLAPYFPGGYSGPSTDWQDEIFQSADIRNYQFSAAGGTDRVNYYFSTNYIEQAGIVPHSDFDRVTLRVNNDYELSERVTVGHNLTFTHSDDQRPPAVLSSLYRAEPTLSPTGGSGFNPTTLSSAGNPAAVVQYTHNDGNAQRLVGNAFGTATFPHGFELRSSFGIDYGRSKLRTFTPEFFVSPEQQNQESKIEVRFEGTDSWLWENTLTWRWLTDAHRLTLLGGITAQSHVFEALGGSRVNVAGENESLWYLNAGEESGQTNDNPAEEWRMLSYLFRANYTLLDRYLLTASLRVDGSSRFVGDHRYGWFPSFAAGWDLAQEAFLADVDWIDAFKVRASWGTIGNDKIGPYPSVARITGNLNYVLGDPQSLAFGAAPVALANPDVQWEETTQYNLGVDAALFRSRIETTLDYYNRTTDGILVEVPIPQYVGVNSQPFVNAAKVRNRGFEGALTWRGQLGALGIELSGNGATVDNEVLALGQGKEEIYGGGLPNEIPYTTRTVVGQPIGSFWGYEIVGVYQDAADITSSPYAEGVQPGDLKYADTNGRDADGNLTGIPNDTIDSADMTFIGSPIPDLIYGFDASVRFGAFDLSVGLSGQTGNEVFNAKKAVRFEVENFERSYLDRWTGPGTSTTEPRITNAGYNYQSSERFIEDGSFLKLHTATLGYQLPQGLLQRWGMDVARVYVRGTNLLLSTPYSGYTPELAGQSVIASGLDQFAGVYPPSRVLTVGIDVTF